MNPSPRKLADLCASEIALVDPKRDPDKEFWYIDISSIDNRTKEIALPQKVVGKLASVRARQIVRTNDVLVATVRPNGACQ